MKLLIILLMLGLSSCSTWEKYGNEIEDMADRVEVGIGFAVKDSWIYGPLRGKLRASEKIHPVADEVSDESPKLYKIEGSK